MRWGILGSGTSGPSWKNTAGTKERTRRAQGVTAHTPKLQSLPILSPASPARGNFSSQRPRTQLCQFRCRALSTFTSSPSARKIAIRGLARPRDGWEGAGP